MTHVITSPGFSQRKLSCYVKAENAGKEEAPGTNNSKDSVVSSGTAMTPCTNNSKDSSGTTMTPGTNNSKDSVISSGTAKTDSGTIKEKKKKTASAGAGGDGDPAEEDDSSDDSDDDEDDTAKKDKKQKKTASGDGGDHDSSDSYRSSGSENGGSEDEDGKMKTASGLTDNDMETLKFTARNAIFKQYKFITYYVPSKEKPGKFDRVDVCANPLKRVGTIVKDALKIDSDTVAANWTEIKQKVNIYVGKQRSTKIGAMRDKLLGT